MRFFNSSHPMAKEFLSYFKAIDCIVQNDRRVSSLRIEVGRLTQLKCIVNAVEENDYIEKVIISGPLMQNKTPEVMKCLHRLDKVLNTQKRNETIENNTPSPMMSHEYNQFMLGIFVPN